MSAELMKKALVISMESELDSLPPNQELKKYHKFSYEFEKKMEKLIKISKIKYVTLAGYKIRRSIAAAASIIIIISASMTVEAIRLPVINFIEKIYEEFSELIFNDKEENSPEKIEDKHEPNFIPEGYSKLEETNYETYYQIIYSNAEKNELIYEQFTLNYDVTINTEEINTKEIFINGATGITYSQNGLTTVIFSDGIYAYSISGYEDESILKQMAESIK
ncbi:DUF4367 domain-containing protein [Sedimentibacter saalensis]|uniref:Uncharacterized protein DUF4367 n=1 Tax=Sedimentibacter saalensis TaxID=130788 RepID=A0A562JKG6_9FIRM|nr:DUF4367 domain-containing protein [Sedimentibacter saalensis]TWH83802.1 uncharacterized protein DUF4367 [Sedimentibacter saalensis]